MECKYIKSLNNINSINDFEDKVSYKFDKLFIDFVKENNGGRPLKKTFNTDKSEGRRIKSFLSFNQEDIESIWKVSEWNPQILEKGYVSIGISDSGDLICFAKDNNGVVYFDLDEEMPEKVADSFDAFLKALY